MTADAGPAGAPVVSGARPERRLHRVGVGHGHLLVEQRGTSRTPLVMLHGFLGTRRTFAGVRDELARSRQTVTFDFSGHGDSSHLPAGRGYSFAGLTDDLHRVLDWLGTPQVHLLGHSMGGVIAMMYATAHPDRTASLILADTAPAPTLPTDALKAVADLACGRGMAAVLDTVLATRSETGSAVPEEVTRGMLHTDPRAIAELVDELGSYPDQTDALRALACPVSIVVGEHDPLRPASEALAAALGDTPDSSRLHIIAGAGHAALWDNPHEWVAAVQAHLGNAA